jgi:hypothetical protein
MFLSSSSSDAFVSSLLKFDSVKIIPVLSASHHISGATLLFSRQISLKSVPW